MDLPLYHCHQLKLTVEEPNLSYVGLFGYIGSGGEVKNVGIENVNISGNNNTGALCSYNSGGIISNCYVTGMVNGNVRVGGLCGENDSGLLSNSYSNCIVSGDDDVGGLCGENSGTISSCNSTGSVSGDDYIGGLCGDNWNGTINNSYSTGIVSGDISVGGLCGNLHSGTVSSSFWDVNSSGVSISYGGTGLTTVEMMDANTFLDAGWDFVDEVVNGTEDIWSIEGVDYPRLWWERCLDQIEVEMKLTLPIE